LRLGDDSSRQVASSHDRLSANAPAGQILDERVEIRLRRRRSVRIAAGQDVHEQNVRLPGERVLFSRTE